ncbi:predicted protein [Uncinocarpus reesii 1704]|uniref:CFEM domain-containing protein n=1 Tax=Uncinocarpus reesii (strain UAMH 1704) TaxID=336963 RepID=C4JDK0_UNCRE|nr:uncharacterized protein UREG_00760 [Uncinocarpus reesii 1704]EEP75913.1 predicted protein [Uncinocarpus reesii 1704]
MRLSAVVLTSFLAATVLAQDITPILKLPPCPRNCIWSLLQKAGEFGCGSTDAKCLCRNARYQGELEKCATTQCKPNEVDLMRSVGRTYCEQAGAPLPPQPVSIEPSLSPDYPFPSFTSTGGIPVPSPSVTHPNYPYPFPTYHSSGSLSPVITTAIVHTSSTKDGSETSGMNGLPSDDVLIQTTIRCILSTVRINSKPMPPLATGQSPSAPLTNTTSTVPVDSQTLPVVTSPVIVTTTTESSEASLSTSTTGVGSKGPSITIPVESSSNSTLFSTETSDQPSTIIINPPETSTSTRIVTIKPIAPPQTTAPDAAFPNSGSGFQLHGCAILAGFLIAIL